MSSHVNPSGVNPLRLNAVPALQGAVSTPAALMAYPASVTEASSADVFNRLSTVQQQQVSQRTLANGSSAALLEAPGKQFSAMSLVLPVPASNAALLGAFLQGLQDGLTTSKPLLNQALEQGISVNFSDLFDTHAVLSVTGPKGSEKAMAKTVLALLQSATVPENWLPNQFEHHRDIAQRNFQEAIQEHSMVLNNAVDRSLYGSDNPLTKLPQQVLNDLSVLSPKQVSQAFSDIINSPALFKLNMVADLPIDEQARQLSQAFAELGMSNPPVSNVAVSQAFQAQEHGLMALRQQAQPQPGLSKPQPPLLLPKETLERAWVQQAWQAPAMTDPDYIPFLLLTSMMAGMSGVWFNVFRTQNGLVYSTKKQYSAHPFMPVYRATAEVDYDKIPKALESFNTVVQELLQKPVAAEALNQVKQRKIRELRELSQAAMGLLQSPMTNRTAFDLPPYTLEQLEAQLMAVTPAQLTAVAQRYFSPQSGRSVVAIAAPERVLKTLS